MSHKVPPPKPPHPEFPFSRVAGTVNSCPSSPLFIPAKAEKKKPARGARKHIKEGGSGSADGEDPAEIKETCRKKKHKGRANPRDGEGRAEGNKRGGGQGDEGAGDPRRSAVTAKHRDQAPPVRQEQRPHVEQPRPLATGRDLGVAENTTTAIRRLGEFQF